MHAYLVSTPGFQLAAHVGVRAEPLDDTKMCAAGQAYLEVLKMLPEASRSRIYGLALELMAKS